jgi:hypothetical protein
MKSASISIILLAFLGAPAFAAEVIVNPPAPAPGVVVEHHDNDSVQKKVVIHKDSDGCASKTVKKTNGTDTVIKHKTNC